MKIERVIIFILLLVIVWLAWNKRPVVYQHQKDHVIEREIQVGQIEIDSLKNKILEIENLKPKTITIIDSFKIEVEKAEVLKDTNKIVIELKNVTYAQETLINSLEIQIDYYSKLVDVCDSVMTNQNKLIELKDGIIFKQKEIIKKQKKRRFFAIVGAAIIGTFLILK